MIISPSIAHHATSFLLEKRSSPFAENNSNFYNASGYSITLFVSMRRSSRRKNRKSNSIRSRRRYLLFEVSYRAMSSFEVTNTVSFHNFEVAKDYSAASGSSAACLARQGGASHCGSARQLGVSGVLVRLAPL